MYWEVLDIHYYVYAIRLHTLIEHQYVCNKVISLDAVIN